MVNTTESLSVSDFKIWCESFDVCDYAAEVLDDLVHDVFGKMASSENNKRDCPGADEELDGLTHDAFSVLASSKNNEGMEEQIAFLVGNGFSASDLRTRIQDMIRKDLAV